MALQPLTRMRKVLLALVAVDLVLVVVGAIGVFTDSYTKPGLVLIVVGSLITMAVAIVIWVQSNREQMRGKGANPAP